MEYWPALEQHAVMLEKGNGFLLILISNERSTIPGLGQGVAECWSNGLYFHFSIAPVLHHSRGVSSAERDYFAEGAKGASRIKLASPWTCMLSPRGSNRRSPFSSNNLAFMRVRSPLGKFCVRTSKSGSFGRRSILNPPCRG